MIDDLRSLFARPTLLDVLIGFALGTALVAFLNALVSGVIINPIEVSGSDASNSFSSLRTIIANREFSFEFVLEYGLVLLLLAGLAILVSRRAAGILWDDRPMRECPHCLAEIPAAATACQHCTRDVS